MSEALIGSLMVAVLGVIGNIVASALTSNKAQAVTDAKLEAYKEQMKEQIEDVREDIQELKKSQDKHNNLVERVAVLERDDKTAFNRIDELRQDIRNIQKEI